MNTQPTPETDAALYPMNGVDIVWPDFARKLERERDEWKSLAAQYSAEREHNAMQALAYKAERDALQDELVRLTDTKRPSRETSNKLDLTP